MITEPSEFRQQLLDIQNSVDVVYTTLPSDEPRFIINANTRTITIPPEFQFLGVKNDHNAETVYFEIDRYFDDEDLSQHTCVVQFSDKNNSNDGGIYPVTTMDTTSVDGKIIFGWEIKSDATSIVGDIYFSVRFYSINSTDYVFTYNFNTLTAKSIILDTLDVDNPEIFENYPSELDAWLDRMNELEAGTSGKVEEIEAKGQEVLTEINTVKDSIPEDYSTLSSDVDGLKSDLGELNELTIDVIVSDNNFDSVFDESGYIDNSGINQASTTFKRTSKYCELIQGEDDKVYVYTSEQNSTITVMLYDENKNYINQIGCNDIDSNSKIVPLARYFRVYTRTEYDGNLYISRTVQGADVNYEYKRKRFIDESTLPLPFGKKTIVNFGDSMFGNFRDYTSISNYLSKLNGATVYNVGFGGCLMAQRYISGVSESSNNAWSAFSMYNLASAICTQDFTMQDTYKNYGTTELNKLPDYFSAQVDVLKSIDFTKVDIITIAYGTNDWTNNRPIDDTEDGFDITTYIGALKQSIKLIQQTYPMIKILVITPIWRWFSDGSDSDSKEYTYGTLVDYKNALVTACKKMRVPVLDSYESLSLSMYNKDTYFEDYTHLNSFGRHMYAELIDGALRLLY